MTNFLDDERISVSNYIIFPPIVLGLFAFLPLTMTLCGTRDRQDALAGWRGPLSRRGFDWVTPPVLNRYTRLAVTMSPARAILRVAGYEMAGAALPEQVTQTCEI